MILDTAALDNRGRYQLLTSLVVPRPIAWLSTRSAAGAPNLAPFSYFAALSATPFLVGVSIGSRAGQPKDSLRNIGETGAFCVNLATAPQLREMNESAGEWGPMGVPEPVLIPPLPWRYVRVNHRGSRRHGLPTFCSC